MTSWGQRVCGLVSVCLSARNANETVVEAARSILNQTHSHLELFIVDDASNDGMADKIKKNLCDPRATLIELCENIGTYAAKNLVLSKFARGEFFAHQDADDISLPARFERQLEYLERTGGGGCGTAIDEFFADRAFEPRFSRDVIPTFSEIDNFWHKTNIYPERLSWKSVYDPSVPAENLKLVMNGSMLFRAGALADLGGFDGRTPVAADSELIMRMIPFHAVGNLPEVLYARRFHEGSLTRASATNFESPIRREYLSVIEARRRAIADRLFAEEIDEARKLCRQDMFFPDCKYMVTALGN